MRINMKKVFFYIIGLLILGIILFLVFTQIPKNPQTPQGESNLEIYDAVDDSIDNYLNQAQEENREQNIYDSVDASVEQFLNK